MSRNKDKKMVFFIIIKYLIDEKDIIMRNIIKNDELYELYG